MREVYKHIGAACVHTNKPSGRKQTKKIRPAAIGSDLLSTHADKALSVQIFMQLYCVGVMGPRCLNAYEREAQ